MSTEFQPYKMRRVLKMDGGDGCTTLLLYHELKKLLRWQILCFMYFTTIKKNQKKKIPSKMVSRDHLIWKSGQERRQ